METWPLFPPTANYSLEALDGLWRRPVHGFVWSPTSPAGRATGDRGPWLTPADGPNARFETYPLMRSRGLLAAFLALGHDPSEEHVRAFANRWGCLRSPEHPDTPHVEALATWQAEAWRLRLLREDWDAVAALRQRGRADTARNARYLMALRQRFRWLPDPRRVGYRAGVLADGRTTATWEDNGHPVFEVAGVLSAQNVEPAVFGRFQGDDVSGPAHYLVIRAVNEQLRGHVHPIFSATGDGQVKLLPDSLLSGLYLLFGLELSQRQPTEGACGNPKCPNGGRFFRKRRDQRFCNKNCRELAAYYRRKDVGQPA
jgi:hypothetical protein